MAGTLSGSLHQWRQEVAAGRSDQSWEQQQRSRECWGMLRMAIPLITCTLFIVGMILCVDLGLWTAEKKQAIEYVATSCRVTRSIVNQLTCSRQADCSVPNKCHHQVYYTCYYPSWELAYKVPILGLISSTIIEETSDFNSVAEVKQLLTVHQGTTTCYYNMHEPRIVQWQHPDPFPFFVFMIAPASILGLLFCCIAINRVCNLEAKMKKARSRKALSSTNALEAHPFGDGTRFGQVMTAQDSRPQPGLSWHSSQYGMAVFPEQYGNVVIQHAQV